MASPRESNSLCLKRKLVQDCQLKECKSCRFKVENGPSFASSAKGCNCCCTQPNLANDCVNFLNSGVPNCIMYYKQGSWHNFPEQITKSLVEEFRGKKSSVVAVMKDEPILVDFLSMTLVNLKSRKQQSVAWFDDTGKCFSPSLFFDEETDDMVKADAANVEDAAQGVMSAKIVNSPPEVVKQVVLESSTPVSQKTSIADILRKKITSVERGSKDFMFVQDLFLSGMGPFATKNSLLHVYRYSPSDITAQCRLEAFERQMRSTKGERGDANVRYGWLGSRKNDIVRILINGLGTTGTPVEKSGLSAGVYLAPENRIFTSVGLCDVDEKGVQYVLLCRVILGNMEAIEPGSQESFPSSEIYDSGVDDCLNPKCYVMWPSHLSTHIWLEYLVSFKLAPQVQNYLLGLKGLWFHPSPKEVATDICALQPVTCESGQGPTTPWISFKVLFEVIQDKISSVARELLLHHYEELKESKITREEMVKKMMIIVGEKILLEALKKLHHCPSLWYKSRVEAVSNDPTKTAAEHLDDTGRNCLTPSANHGDSHAPNGNHGNSHAPNAVTEQSKALSTKGCGTLAADMVPKGHDFLAASSMPETSSPAVAIFRDSPGAEPEGIVSPIQIMSPGISATRCSKTQDSFVGRMPPIVCEGLLRTSGKPVSLGMEICNSVAPTRGHPGYASLAPTNGSKSHGIFAPDFAPSPKVCESIVPRLALGNSKSTGMKRFNSAPRMTQEGQEFLSLGIASQSSALHSVKNPNGLTSAVIPPVHAPERGNSASMSTAGCDPLALGIAQKGHDPPAWSKEPKRHECPTADMMPQSYHHQAQDAATKVHNAPTSITGEPKDQVAPCCSQNKSSGSILDDSSHVFRAADILVALSTPREKGGH